MQLTVGSRSTNGILHGQAHPSERCTGARRGSPIGDHPTLPKAVPKRPETRSRYDNGKPLCPVSIATAEVFGGVVARGHHYGTAVLRSIR